VPVPQVAIVGPAQCRQVVAVQLAWRGGASPSVDPTARRDPRPTQPRPCRSASAISRSSIPAAWASEDVDDPDERRSSARSNFAIDQAPPRSCFVVDARNGPGAARRRGGQAAARPRQAGAARRQQGGHGRLRPAGRRVSTSSASATVLCVSAKQRPRPRTSCSSASCHHIAGASFDHEPPGAGSVAEAGDRRAGATPASSTFHQLPGRGASAPSSARWPARRRDSIDVRLPRRTRRRSSPSTTAGVRNKGKIKTDVEFYSPRPSGKIDPPRRTWSCTFLDAATTVSHVGQAARRFTWLENYKPAIFVVNKWGTCSRASWATGRVRRLHAEGVSEPGLRAAGVSSRPRTARNVQAGARPLAQKPATSKAGRSRRHRRAQTAWCSRAVFRPRSPPLKMNRQGRIYYRHARPRPIRR